MELDNLKAAWLELDNKLQQTQKLKEETIKEMYRAKANKSINKILNYDIFSLIIGILLLPFIIWFASQPHVMKDFWMILFLIYWGIYLIGAIIYSIFKIYHLLKFDLTKPMSHNIKIISQFNIFLKREKPIYFIAAVIGIIPAVLMYIQHNVKLWLWVFFVCVLLIAVILTIWLYKRLYDTNIKSIMSSLDELKEIEE